MELNYEDIFKTPLKAMRLNRSDPFIKRDIKWISLFLFIHGLYTITFALLVHNIIFINIKDNNFSQACKNGTVCMVYCVISFEFCVMTWKQEPLQWIMNNIKKDYELAKNLTMTEQEVVLEFAKKGEYVSKQWLYIAGGGALLFPFKNTILYVFHWVEGADFKLIPIYELVYPSFIEDRKDNLFIYFFTYMVMLSYAIYSSVMYTAFVPLGPNYMLHACGQLVLVKMRIDDLFKTGDVGEVEEKLKEIVKQLQYIYSFVDQIIICFRVTYEVTLKVTSIMMPITCYEVLESLKIGEFSLEFVTFIIGGALFSSTPCFYSDLLMEKGEDIRLSMYCSGWETMYDRGIRSTVRIVLQRALRPVAIQTLFRTVCLEALTDVIHQAFTIFNLLNAVCT